MNFLATLFLKGSGSNENDERVVIYDFITIVLSDRELLSVNLYLRTNLALYLSRALPIA